VEIFEDEWSRHLSLLGMRCTQGYMLTGSSRTMAIFESVASRMKELGM
jgi:hypothetical protein